MPKKDYGNLEDKILKILNIGSIFKYNGTLFKVLISDKPKTQRGGGEPKTDVFIRAQSLKSQDLLDLKISVKMAMANIFIENKITPERFNEIFSEETKQKITNSLNEDIFPQILEKNKSIHKSKRFPLGWKCEIVLNDTRRNRVRVLVTPEEAEEIYTGKKRPERFKNALINRQEIKNSGIPEYILSTLENRINSSKDIISQLIPIKDYIKIDENRIIDIVLTGLGFFVKFDKKITFKWDGNRPLLIGVKWYYNEKEIQGLLDLENLFRYRGNEMANLLINAFYKAKVPLSSISDFWLGIVKKLALEPLKYETVPKKRFNSNQRSLSNFTH